MLAAADAGCDAATVLPTWATSLPHPLVFAPRGQCSFEQKARAVAAAGGTGAALVVLNSLEGLYASANVSAPDPWQVPQCDQDCAQGSGWVPAAEAATLERAAQGYQCGETDGCANPGKCALTGVVDGGGADAQHQVCCVADDYMSMGGSFSGIPAVFATLHTAGDVEALLNGRSDGVPATLELRYVPGMDPAGLLIWALGVAAAVGAAWRSSATDRAEVAARRAPARAPREAYSEAIGEAQDITMKQALCFLVAATVMLTGMFLLVKAGVPIVTFVIVLYSFGAASGVAYIAILPVVDRLAPRLREKKWDVRYVGDVTANYLAAYMVGASVVIWFVVARHQPYAWILQDFCGVCVSAVFLLTVRLSQLRIATALLVLFFLYDIFMVFVTPLITQTSVMVDVATAGAPTVVPNQACYCRLHPEDDSACGPGESMPILLRFPRVMDYRGGFAMLGLGDIIVPGLLLSYACRVDIKARGTVRGGYFPLLAAGYAVGLFGANMAVWLMQLGQPALLYIVPTTLGPFLALAYRRGELREMWKPKPPGDSERPLTGRGEDDEEQALGARATLAEGADSTEGVVLAIRSDPEDASSVGSDGTRQRSR